MDANVVVEVVRVVERDTLEAFELRGKLVELGEPPAALLFDADFDLADPAALKFDALRDDFFLEAVSSLILGTGISSETKERTVH